MQKTGLTSTTIGSCESFQKLKSLFIFFASLFYNQPLFFVHFLLYDFYHFFLQRIFQKKSSKLFKFAAFKFTSLLSILFVLISSPIFVDTFNGFTLIFRKYGKIRCEISYFYRVDDKNTRVTSPVAIEDGSAIKEGDYFILECSGKDQKKWFATSINCFFITFF